LVVRRREAKNVTPEMIEKRFCGDAWTFVAIGADTKLVISWLVGKRDAGCATEFLQDVEGGSPDEQNSVDYGRPQDVSEGLS
jgi:hypothetical protein